jgi:hypothetical protein
MRFSERLGIKAPRTAFQIGSVDEALRNGLWTALDLTILESLKGRMWVSDQPAYQVIQLIWVHFFKLPLDQIDGNWPRIRPKLREWFFGAEWHEVYDFLEFVAQSLSGVEQRDFIDMVNSFLKRDMSGYRFVGEEIGQLTNEEEVKAIEGALADTSPLRAVNEHLAEGLKKLTDRKAPDYRNSIKEAVSAIEALCRLITGDPSATLGQAIKRLKDAGVHVHPAVEKAWSSLYGYTSDAQGIRHAMSDDALVSFAQAKYMLVSCSAFATYLIDQCNEVGIALSRPGAP